mmetsp:Transcript_73009/g.121877  ORF Transcript_73009/g.121877 Transcript_73009/m.121877 type:complete len:246 (-) Transcript_73009:1509-2246(-)
MRVVFKGVTPEAATNATRAIVSNGEPIIVGRTWFSAPAWHMTFCCKRGVATEVECRAVNAAADLTPSRVYGGITAKVFSTAVSTPHYRPTSRLWENATADRASACINIDLCIRIKIDRTSVGATDSHVMTAATMCVCRRIKVVRCMVKAANNSTNAAAIIYGCAAVVVDRRRLRAAVTRKVTAAIVHIGAWVEIGGSEPSITDSCASLNSPKTYPICGGARQIVQCRNAATAGYCIGASGEQNGV